MARPMVVGDRLWLFSQAPNGPASVQSMMLNNGPMPIAPLRSYPSPSPTSTCHGNPTSGSPILESARNALLARGQPLNYGLPKSMPGPSPFKPSSLYDNGSYKFNPYLPHPSANHSPHFPGSPFATKSSNSVESSSDLYLQMKYGFGPSSTSRSFNGPSLADHHLAPLDFTAAEEPAAGTTNGLAELERAFGDRMVALSSPGRLQSSSAADCEAKTRREQLLLLGNGEAECANDPGANSDVDCEEMEEDELDV